MRWRTAVTFLRKNWLISQQITLFSGCQLDCILSIVSKASLFTEYFRVCILRKNPPQLMRKQKATLKNGRRRRRAEKSGKIRRLLNSARLPAMCTAYSGANWIGSKHSQMTWQPQHVLMKGDNDIISAAARVSVARGRWKYRLHVAPNDSIQSHLMPIQFCAS